MPINLQSLKQRGAKVPVEFYGETANVVYDPTKLTSDFRAAYMERARELQDGINKHREYVRKEGVPFEVRRLYESDAELMLMLVKDWDIMLDGESGEKLPLEVDAVLAHLPNNLVKDIAAAIWADAGSLGKKTSSTDGKTSSSSSSGSNQTAPSENSRTGT